MYCLIYCCVSVVTYDTNKAIHSRLSFFDRIADICFLVCGIKVFSKVESVLRFAKIAWCFMYAHEIQINKMHIRIWICPVSSLTIDLFSRLFLSASTVLVCVCFWCDFNTIDTW